MTCIVGLEHKNKVYIGADGMSSNGHSNSTYAPGKVFKLSDRFLIGYTTSFRMAQIIQYHTKIRDQQPEENDFEFMVVGFIEEIRRALKEFGYSKTENNVDEGGNFLVGYRRKLYEIENDYQINTNNFGYDSVGAGTNFALGSLHTTKNNLDLTPKQKIKIALKAASEHCVYVRPPYIVESI